MTFKRTWIGLLATALIAVSTGLEAQVGKGLMNPNVMSQSELAALPHMTPAIVSALIAKRPFPSIVDLNAFLLEQGLTQEQVSEIYEKAFVQLNLNTCTLDEILLIPRIARRMRIEFPEYRPWKNWEQFDREIGKYLRANPGELDRLRQYMFIPMDVNAASDADVMTIPGMTQPVLQQIRQGRPWKSQDDFASRIGQTTTPKEAARLWRYFVQPD